MKSVTYDEAHKIVSFSNSINMLEAVLSLHPRMQFNEWLKLLGEMWSCCDRIVMHRLRLKHIIGTDGPIREMMDVAEQAAYDALPDTITVFRGCCPHNMLGPSWTTDRSVAANFPFQIKFLVKEPILVTGRVKKKNILAIKLDREEFEVISFSTRRVDKVPLQSNQS
jgi:hypothetical protein